MNTFWNHKHEAVVAVLNAQVPGSGEVTDPKRPMLEAWRLMSNAYHDVYCNGAGNWRLRGPGFRKACRMVGVLRVPTKADLLGFYGEEMLEECADRVFLAALMEHTLAEAGRLEEAA